MAMTPRLVTCCLAKNESSKFLPSALLEWSKFSDSVILLDDASTDDTAQIAIDAGATVHFRDGGAWGNESPARQQLFDLAVSNTDYGDWILVLDADMTPAKDPRELAFGGHVGAWSFPLFDLWDLDPLRYRWDMFWQAHLHPRIWMFRRPADNDWVWPDRGIHCGHLPLNFTVERGCAAAPEDHALLHYAYSTAELRKLKHKQYASVAAQLSQAEIRHANTIIDEHPQTYALPFKPDYVLELARPKPDAA